MEKNKKIMLGFILVMMIMIISGCDPDGESSSDTVAVITNTPPDTKKKKIDIKCDIRFAKTVDEKYQAVELFEGDNYEINTKIYAIVDFTLVNKEDEDIPLNFKIQIPNAKYYSTHEYKKGIIEPTEELKSVGMEDGSTEQMVELSGMNFIAKTGAVPFDYSYCFEIEANQICENVQFKAIFSTDDGGESIFTKTYSFVQ